ncbi:MAG: response regulator [Chitinophagaceae bacterium]|nr:response regulator [Chitinophagaceae bacterium]
MILDNLAEGFGLEGYKVLAANNGNNGVELARSFIPDLIVSEIMIDEMNGYEVLRLLLLTPATAEIPFIFCTTKSEKADRLFALKLGADDYVIKPFEFESFFLMVKMWIASGTQRCIRN